MSTHANPDPEPAAERPTLPETISSPNAKLVYFYVDVRGEATVSDLQSDLGLPKMSLFSVLNSLSGEGLVERDGDRVRVA